MNPTNDNADSILRSADKNTSESDLPIPVMHRRERMSSRLVPADSNAKLSLDSMQQHLRELSARPGQRHLIIGQFVKITCELTNAIWCGQFCRLDSEQLGCVAEHNGLADQNLGLARSSILPSIESVIGTANARITRNGELTVITVPVFVDRRHHTRSNEVLCVALNLRHVPVEPFLLIAQLVATHIGRWYEQDRLEQLDWQVDATAAIAELMSEISMAEKPKQAAMMASNQLAHFLNAQTVAIGFCIAPGSKRTKIAAISGTTEFDAGGEIATRIEATLNETMLRNSVTTLPCDNTDDRSMKLAHQQLIESNRNSSLVSAPLTTGNQTTIGAWLCILPAGDDPQQQKTIQFAQVVSRYLADALSVAERANEGPIRRFNRQAHQSLQGRAGKIAIAAACAVLLLMAIPIPHRISCPCSLEPSVRQFAVAPHDGILLESFVKPGDLVVAGQALATMDDREVRLEAADLIAEREVAIKKRDVNRSARDAAATQIAEFEIAKLDARIRLIRFKQDNLEIKSAVGGIVLQGDLDDAKGAPVRTGDVLMEVAPLETLRLKIDVPERDVAYIKPGQGATIVLDGNPFDAIRGEIELLQPKSEVRDNRNVFVSEVTIENETQTLRPGMRGFAKINEGWRPLGWIMLHRPCEKVYSILR